MIPAFISPPKVEAYEKPKRSVKRFLRKLVGHKHDSRFDWGEFSWHPKSWQIGIEAYRSGMFEHNMLVVHALILALYIHLPTDLKKRGDGCMRGNEPKWGFCTHENYIALSWGTKSKHWDFPVIGWHHYSTEILDLGRQRLMIEYSKPYRLGGLAPFPLLYELKEALKAQHSLKANYRYILKRGGVQDRIATVSIGRMVWRRKWLGPLFPTVRTSIDVTFSDEVGEKSGSWKGGCIGCGYEMLAGESALQCLRRMERERKF